MAMPSDPSAAAVRAAEPGEGPEPAVPAPLEAISWPVCTARLQLRPATPDDVEATWKYRQLPVVNYWLTSAPVSFEEYRAVFCHPPRLATVLIVERDAVVIGDLQVVVKDAWAQYEIADRARGVQAELGCSFDPAHSGQGYATEAVRELIRICFTDLGLRRLTAGCFAGNEASWRLLERLGFRREQYAVRDSLHRSGAWLDGMGYALLADEWAQPGGDAPPGQPPV